MYLLSTNGPEETTALGRVMGEAVVSPVGFRLGGSYGTGKTTFAQGLALGLGVEGIVRSPSYNIIKTYIGGKFGLVHADLYRMKSLADIHELGLNDIMGLDKVIAVEWPEKVGGFSLELPTVQMTFSFMNEPGDSHSKELENSRRVTVSFSSDCPAGLAEAISALVA